MAFSLKSYKSFAAMLAGVIAVGHLKNRASSWKDYFFEEAYAQPGS